jgi:phosphatidylserine decarboxylase
MKFHKEGYASLGLVLVFGAIIIAIAHYFFNDFLIAKAFAYTLSIFLFITILQFFRHPTRQHTKGDNLVISPADGKIVVIEETTEGEYFKDKRYMLIVILFRVLLAFLSIIRVSF